MSEVFRPKSEDKEYLEKFDIVLDDQAEIYDRCVRKARTMFEDDRAVQACAYTLFQLTVPVLNQPILFYTPVSTGKKSVRYRKHLENIKVHAEYLGQSVSDAFCVVASQWYQTDAFPVIMDIKPVDIRRAMKLIFGEIGVESVNDIGSFVDLARLINMTIVANSEGMVPKEKYENFDMVYAKVFGQQFGRPVEEILGEVEEAPSVDGVLGYDF